MPRPTLELVKTGDAFGASHLQINQCFEPQRIVKLLFLAERIEVEVTGQDETQGETGTVHYDNAPEWARTWEEFRRFAIPLNACQNMVFDGTTYIHRMVERGGETSVTWVNPNWRENPLQMTVIRGYIELTEAAGIRRLLRM